jgi:hypothetical protein
MKKSLLLGLLVLMPLVTWSYDSFEISNAAGMYLTSADIQQKLSTSQCGYVIKKAPPTVEGRLQEILGYLNYADKIELEKFVRSSEFNQKMKNNDVIINDIKKAFIAEGYDEKTTCGLLLGTLSQMIAKGDSAWRNVIKFR